jgi:hypothetical protein
MGSEDVKRQSPNVYRMKLLGATVVPVESGSRTLKDALNEAMRDWVANVDNTFYIIGTVAGPHPYPMMVRDFQSIIGTECIAQMPDMLAAQLRAARSQSQRHINAARHAQIDTAGLPAAWSAALDRQHLPRLHRSNQPRLQWLVVKPRQMVGPRQNDIAVMVKPDPERKNRNFDSGRIVVIAEQNIACRQREPVHRTGMTDAPAQSAETAEILHGRQSG